MIKPQPCSSAGSSCSCGSGRTPQSVTATRTNRLCRAISTVNHPPLPVAVCRTALLPSSVATDATSCRAGQSGMRVSSHSRSRLSWLCSPGNTRRDTGASVGPASGRIRPPFSESRLTTGIPPPSSSLMLALTPLSAALAAGRRPVMPPGTVPPLDAAETLASRRTHQRPGRRRWPGPPQPRSRSGWPARGAGRSPARPGWLRAPRSDRPARRPGRPRRSAPVPAH